MERKKGESCTLFSSVIGNCTMTMRTDKRNVSRFTDGKYPLCLCFSIGGRRYYHSLGEFYSDEELLRIKGSTGRGEKHGKTETNYQKQARLKKTFQTHLAVLTEINDTGVLTLERIKTILTGKGVCRSFISEWEGVIRQKRLDGRAGTASSYAHALNSFVEHTGFTTNDGFALDVNTIRKWMDGMERKGLSSTAQGIYLRSCRVIVNKCIHDGFIKQRAYMFGKADDQVSIPSGSSRKDCYLNVEQMTELYKHWTNRDLELPRFSTANKVNLSYSITSDKERDGIYLSLGLFLAQYLCCGCNLIDLASLRYDRYYYDSRQRAFHFVRYKTARETRDGEGMEVIIPITEPLQAILDDMAAKPDLDAFVFPFILGDDREKDEEIVRRRIHQENHNIAYRMRKVAASIGWEVSPSSTWCRHSFATNMNEMEVPINYISDAMGHSLGNKGNITRRYISPFSLEKRLRYNSYLIQLDEQPVEHADEKDDIIKQLSDLSAEDLKLAMNIIKGMKTGNK